MSIQILRRWVACGIFLMGASSVMGENVFQLIQGGRWDQAANWVSPQGFAWPSTVEDKAMVSNVVGASTLDLNGKTYTIRSFYNHASGPLVVKNGTLKLGRVDFQGTRSYTAFENVSLLAEKRDGVTMYFYNSGSEATEDNYCGNTNAFRGTCVVSVEPMRISGNQITLLIQDGETDFQGQTMFKGDYPYVMNLVTDNARLTIRGLATEASPYEGRYAFQVKLGANNEPGKNAAIRVTGAFKPKNEKSTLTIDASGATSEGRYSILAIEGELSHLDWLLENTRLVALPQGMTGQVMIGEAGRSIELELRKDNRGTYIGVW